MEEIRETDSDITSGLEDTQFWSMYPQNVYVATTGTNQGAFSLQNKKIMAVFVFIGLTILMTIVGFFAGREYNISLLASLMGFILGILISVFLYVRLLRDKFNEDLESDTGNKILKLFRVRLNDSEQTKVIGDADLMSYTSGDIFTVLRIEIGNSAPSSEDITAEFLDKVFKSAHQLRVKIKNYNIPAEWKNSDVHHNHLRRLTKVQDKKLKGTLAALDEHQSKVYEESTVLGIHLMFVTNKGNVVSLESLNAMIEDWRKDYFFMSSIRSLRWLKKEEVLESMCSFLTVEILDVTSSLNKKSVKYDVRKLVKVFSKNRIKANEHIHVESRASVLRKPKRRAE